MITKKDILKMVRHIKRRTRGVPDKRLIHPRREWGIGVVLALILLIGGIGYTGIVYKEFDQIGEDTVGQVSRSVRYESALVDQAITFYQTQKAVYDTLLAGSPAPVVDTDEADGAEEALSEEGNVVGEENGVVDVVETEGDTELTETPVRSSDQEESENQENNEVVGNTDETEADVEEDEDDEAPVLLES